MNTKELAEYIATHEPVDVHTPVYKLEKPPQVYFESPSGMTAREQRRRKQRKKRKIRYGL